MPRSRTRARIRAAKRAAGLIPNDPERTAGRLGDFHRKVWRRFAKLDAYNLRCDGQVHPDRRTRRRAIAAEIEAWFAAVIADEAKGRG